MLPWTTGDHDRLHFEVSNDHDLHGDGHNDEAISRVLATIKCND